MAYDPDTAERVRRLLSDRGDVVEKRVVGGLCFMVGGKMACSVSGRGGLLVRVGPEAMERVLHEPHVAPMRMGTRTMSGFVRVDAPGYRSDAALAKWVQRGVDFVATLPAKKRAKVKRKR
jgi:TfoX/Sxy family transcriptional regulator of competence genes